MIAELKRILLAEDNPKDVELTLAALEEHNLANEVITVKDGAEALDYVYRRGKYASRPDNNPVVVLLDLKMKGDERLKAIPVVVLTSSREERDLVVSYNLGANAYVVKPVNFQDFVSAVKELGVFWAMINEPPPGSVRLAKS